jgi:hypothetical protein
LSLLTIKVLSAIAILAVGLIGGAIPIVAGRYANSRRFFSLGNAFAGGVFLGAGLIHLLPDGNDKLRDVTAYPLAFLLATLGLALLLLIDRVIFSHPAGRLLRRARRRHLRVRGGARHHRRGALDRRGQARQVRAHRVRHRVHGGAGDMDVTPWQRAAARPAARARAIGHHGACSVPFAIGAALPTTVRLTRS